MMENYEAHVHDSFAYRRLFNGIHIASWPSSEKITFDNTNEEKSLIEAKSIQHGQKNIRKYSFL